MAQEHDLIWSEIQALRAMIAAAPSGVLYELIPIDNASAQLGITYNGFSFAVQTRNFSTGVDDTQQYHPRIVPPTWLSGADATVRIFWRSIAGNNGNVMWRIRYVANKSGEGFAPGAGSPVDVITASDSFNTVTTDLAIPAADLEIGDTLSIRIDRVGSDILDTMNDEAGTWLAVLGFPN